MTLAIANPPEFPAADAGPPAVRMADWDTAVAVCKSGLFKGADSPEKVYTLMLICEADRLHPIEAMRRYHIIEGQPSMRSDAMLAEFQARGGEVEWTQYDNLAAEAIFSHPRHCKVPKTVRFTMDDALEAGFPFGKWNERTQKHDIKTNWRRTPGAMLRARVITAAIRMIMPAIVVGIYSPEEVEDFADQGPGRTIDVTPRPSPPAPAPGPADVPVLGQRSAGHDPRVYSEVAKGAASEANAEFSSAAKARGVDAVASPFNAKQISGAVFSAAVEAGHTPRPAGKVNTGDALRIVAESVYPAHRAWVRTTLDAWIRSQLDGAVKALSGAAPPEPGPEFAASEGVARPLRSEGGDDFDQAVPEEFDEPGAGG